MSVMFLMFLGITFHELNSEFRDFLKLPIDEQLKVVPDINFSSN